MADTAAIASEIQPIHADYYGQAPAEARVLCRSASLRFAAALRGAP